MQTKAEQLAALREEQDNPELFEAPMVYVGTEDNTTEPEKSWSTMMKKIVWICLINGILWVWCSYILAAFDRVQIAEELSKVAVTEIIGVVLVYAIKSVIENLSKHNSWPDKSDTDEPGAKG